MGKTLRLGVCKKYFEEIKSGNKKEEYREFKEYWRKRIIEKPDGYFDKIEITVGYPPKRTSNKILSFPWRGYELKTINHKHFGEDDIYVIAIKLEE